MSDSPQPIAAASFTPSRWVARVGLFLVGAILVSCFGLLIIAGR